MPLVEHHLNTRLVTGGCDYAALAPQDNPGGLPVLYLLHGGGSDRGFLQRMRAEIESAIAASLIDPVVVVTPSAGMSYYLDYHDGSERWETLLLGELRDQVALDYDIDDTRLLDSGISVGGVGCLRLAFRNPGQFVAVASLGAGVDPFLTLADMPDWYAMTADNRIGKKFGEPVDAAFWAANNPANIAHANPTALRDLKIYLEVGTDDSLLNHHNVEFLHRVLFDPGIKHEYRTVLGGDHIGNSLPGRFADALRFLGTTLRPTPPDPAAAALKQNMRKAFADAGISPPP